MPEPLAIEINGSITPGELTRFHYFHTWLRVRKFLLILAFITIVAFAVLGLSIVEVRWLPLIVLSILIALPYFAARRQLTAQKYLTQTVRQIFTPQTIERSTQSMSSSIAWSIVREIYETGTLFLLYIAPNQAIIVPKRLFPDIASLQTWKQLAKSQTPRFIENNIIGRWC